MLALECLRLVLVGACVVIAGAGKLTRVPAMTYIEREQMFRYTSGMPEGEIGFKIDDGGENFPRVPEDRIPESFQHRVSCNSPSEANPWIQDDYIGEAVAYTNCRNLVIQSTITLKTYFADSKPRSIPFRPVPVSQDWKGYTVTSSPGQSARQLSSCCDADKCPNVCLVNSKAQRCHLEIFTVGAAYVADINSASSQFANAFTKKFQMKEEGGRLVRRFRIPCEYCPLTSCNTTCTNGQYATQYSDYQVLAVFLGRALLLPDKKKRAGRGPGDEGRVQDLRARHMEYVHGQESLHLVMRLLLRGLKKTGA